MRRWWVEYRGYRDIWLLIITAFVVVAVAQGLSFANQNHTALCDLRGDLQRRVAASTEYLSEHPHGAPGIPARAIREGIDNQQRTVSALNALNCADDPPVP